VGTQTIRHYQTGGSGFITHGRYPAGRR